MIRFNIQKTIQASAFLIKRDGGARQSYMRLLKLLYLSDRNSLLERHEPICGDTPFAMEQGPVFSATLDLIKGVDPDASEWEKYFRKVGYEIELINDPGNLALSRSELNILVSISERFRNFDEWRLVKWCHRNLPEYEKNWKRRGDSKRHPIPLEDVLEAIDSKLSKEDLVQQMNEDGYFRCLFRDHLPSPSQRE